MPVPDLPDRPRRLRRTAGVRALAREIDLDLDRLVLPLFVRSGRSRPSAAAGLPGIVSVGAERVGALARSIRAEGLRAILLFGLAARKEPDGREARSPRSPVVRALREIRRAAPDLVLWTDVCLCAYTSHGQCGIVRGGEVDNDLTVAELGRVAVVHASAGADFVAPSAMMDGQVAGIRRALDEAGHSSTGIVGYSAKFASALYGPFRSAAGSRPTRGDRKGYQLDPANARAALRELERDAREGADVLMVKPALPSLDVIARARRRIDRPLAAYQVSGEYAMLRAAADRGWLPEADAMTEALLAIRRAGADLIVTYYAREVARGVGGPW